MASFRYLSAVYRNLVRRLERFLRIADIVTQILLLAYFGFLTYSTFHEPALFYPYAAITVLSLFGFVWTLLGPNRKSEISKKVNRVITIGKWAIRGLVITITFVLFFFRSSSDLEKIFWAVSLFFLILQIVIDIVTKEVIRQYQFAMDAIALDIDEIDGVLGRALSALKIKGALAPRAEVARGRSEALMRMSYLNRIEDRLDDRMDGSLLIPVGKKTITKRLVKKTIQNAVKEAENILEKEKLPEFLGQLDALLDGRPLPTSLAEQIQANSYALRNVANPEAQALNPATLIYTLAGLYIFSKNHFEEKGDPDYEYDAFYLDLINSAIIEDYPKEEKKGHIPFFGKKSEQEEMHGLFKRIKKRFAQDKETKKEEPKKTDESK